MRNFLIGLLIVAVIAVIAVINEQKTKLEEAIAKIGELEELKTKLNEEKKTLEEAAAKSAVEAAVISILGRGCDTASRMADQTVFNASEHVWNLENFKEQYSAYQQHVNLYTTSGNRIKKLENNGVFEGQSYDNAVTQQMGAEQMARNIASKYNAASNTGYKAMWKNVMVNGEPLPQRLYPDNDLALEQG